jgi:hypothetical protein
MGLTPYPTYARKIQDEIGKARAEIDVVIADQNTLSFGCVDSNAQLFRATGNYVQHAGGAVFLFEENHLIDWFAYRRGMSGILSAHMYCGYMLVEKRWGKAGTHGMKILQVAIEVQKLNRDYGTNFTMQVFTNGTARPYMSRSRMLIPLILRLSARAGFLELN